ncbi:hypothetical protein [Chromohalobacter sp. 11-W]|uniref:hypothetical protein n=1 Tax=Chromohalobacter sp. 11-W TaxID=2994061 RepID=UPI002468DC6A|nr:hypothetical protein [Chromohalobacter sp. 11-W]
MQFINDKKLLAGMTFGCVVFWVSSTAFAYDVSGDILTTKLERTTNDHALTLPKVSYTRLFDDGSSLMLEKDWYWREGSHDSGWPKHDEFFANYSFPAFRFGHSEKWSLAPQLGAKFRSNVTRALAAIKLGYEGDGWSLRGRYRYENETTTSGTAKKGEAGRVDIYASYELSKRWTVLYNPHYHFKMEDESPDFGSGGGRNYLEQEFIAFYKIDPKNTMFGGYIRRDTNSENASTDPGQRNSSWLLGYAHKF